MQMSECIGERCKATERISSQISLCCGAWAPESTPKESIKAIDTHYGLLLHAQSTNEEIARIGFNIEVDGGFSIDHAPQGAHPRSISRKARCELIRNTTFREDLVKTVIQLAQESGAPYVRGRSGQKHFKLLSKSFTPEHAYRIMDQLYLSLGFTGMNQGYYYYFLAQE